VREGGVVTTDPTDGSLQVQEAFLLQGKRKSKIKRNCHYWYQAVNAQA